MDTAERTDEPEVWDQPSTLAAMLRYVRRTVHFKCQDLTDEQARQVLLPGSPLTTVAALVSHLRWVEWWWFQERFEGRDEPNPWTGSDDPDREMTMAADVPLRRLLDEYDAECARSDQVIATHALDERAQRPFRSGVHPTLYWVVLHLVEETARHNGHLDILREQLDGATGA